jgi:hypothetical protein
MSETLTVSVDATVLETVSLVEVMHGFGMSGGHGADSIVHAATFATAYAATHKGVSEDRAEELYTAYKLGYDGMAQLSGAMKDVSKVQVSCFRTFLKPEVIKGAEVHERTLKLRLKLASDERATSAYNSLVAVNRAVVKAGGKRLTDAQILDVITKKDRAEKDLVEKLEAVKATLIKLDEEGTVAAVREINDRIQVLKLMATTGEQEVEQELADA